MLSLREESMVSGSTVAVAATTSSPTNIGPSTLTCFYLTFEFLIGLVISGFLVFLTVIKSLLPRPPRDLTGDVVLVTGATSNLGSSLVEEFARGGCSVICVDGDDSGVEEIASRLRAKYPGVEQIGARQQLKADESRRRSTRYSLAYRCNLWDRDEIKELAVKVREEVGQLDVLVTCTGTPEQELFDTVSRTLMSHYWTVLAFLPSMLHRERAYVVGITPCVSTGDAYMGSKAAVAGLMDSLGQQFSGRNNRLTFMTVAPKAEPRLVEQNEREIAKEVVQAVQRDLCCISMNWSSKLLYNVRLYTSITTITGWLDT